MVGTATVCLAIRLYARITRMRRLFWDDFFAIAPWILMLGAVIMHTSGWIDLSYRMTMLTAGQPVWAIPTADELNGAFISMLVFAIFFYVTLMLVKISFLLFFRQLAVHGGRETRSKGQKIYWWVVLALCFVTVGVQVGTIQFPCFVNGFMYTYMHCTDNPDIVRGMWISVSVGFFFDVLTEVLSTYLEIPLSNLWSIADMLSPSHRNSPPNGLEPEAAEAQEGSFDLTFLFGHHHHCFCHCPTHHPQLSEMGWFWLG